MNVSLPIRDLDAPHLQRGMSCDEAELMNSAKFFGHRAEMSAAANYHDRRDEKHTLRSPQLRKTLNKPNESDVEELFSFFFYSVEASSEGT